MPVNTSEDGNYLSSEKKKLMIQKVINNLSKSHSVRRLSISRELWGWGVGGGGPGTMVATHLQFSRELNVSGPQTAARPPPTHTLPPFHSSLPMVVILWPFHRARVLSGSSKALLRLCREQLKTTTLYLCTRMRNQFSLSPSPVLIQYSTNNTRQYRILTIPMYCVLILSLQPYKVDSIIIVIV